MTNPSTACRDVSEFHTPAAPELGSASDAIGPLPKPTLSLFHLEGSHEMSNGSGSLQPTFQGHVNTTHDALILFEACLSGTLSHVPRRPHDRERNQLVRSGCVFIYEENASGIKRWTDGVPWSPSRILGNFLVYRELLKPFPPGEKKRATKRNKRPQRPGEPYPRSADGDGSGYEPETPTTPNLTREDSADKELERSLIGSLVDSYGFRDQGLVKKTMSVSVQGVQHHLVSYYKVEDVKHGRLRTPSMDERLRHLRPRYDLIHKQNFRVPLADEMEEMGAAQPDGARGYTTYGSEARPMGASQGYPMPPPNPSGFYGPMEGMTYSGAPHQQSVPVPIQYPPQYYQSQPSHPQVQPKPGEYGGYGPTPQHSQRFEPFNSGMNSSGLPTPIRTASQSQQSSQSMPYPQSNVHNRPTATEGPLDPSYGRGYYPPGGVPTTQLPNYEQPRRHTQPSTSETSVKAESSTSQGPGYPDPSDRQVWLNGPVPLGQGPYGGSHSVPSHWSSSMA